jgi:hypothetical protein
MIQWTIKKSTRVVLLKGLFVLKLEVQSVRAQLTVHVSKSGEEWGLAVFMPRIRIVYEKGERGTIGFDTGNNALNIIPCSGAYVARKRGRIKWLPLDDTTISRP